MIVRLDGVVEWSAFRDPESERWVGVCPALNLVVEGQTWSEMQAEANEALLLLMRELLRREGHAYASGHQFGQGPNWRLRVAREAVRRVGLDPHLLRHGISREVYGAPLVPNWREYLCGTGEVGAVLRPSAATIGGLAVNRWLIPRARARSDYQHWTREAIWEQLIGRTQQVSVRL